MNNPGAKLRAVAAEIVDAVVGDGRSLDAALAEREQGVKPENRPLLRMICYGTLRRHWRLREWVDAMLTRPLKRRDRVVGALLACGLYQLTEMRVPDHAVVSQTVEASRQLRRPKLAGLVNACLRRFMREDWASAEPKSEAARWNHPDWLIERLRADWPDDWPAILDANDSRAPMWLRVNRTKTSVGDYRARLLSAGAAAQPLSGLPDALCLDEPLVVDALPGFREGEVSVQDGAAQLAAQWLSADAGDRVLDACAAPGGKTAHLLEQGTRDVLALDSDERRASAIFDNLARLGLSATIRTADASKPEEWWDGVPFDSVLLDAPCSATGVIRRHPDIKLLRRASDITALAGLQRRLLDAVWPLLKPGGRLLYVTCSVLAAENDDVVGQFLGGHDDAMERDVLPNNNIRDLMSKRACGYQILPGTVGLDGFYYACLEKGPEGPEKVS